GDAQQLALYVGCALVRTALPRERFYVDDQFSGHRCGVPLGFDAFHLLGTIDPCKREVEADAVLTWEDGTPAGARRAASRRRAPASERGGCASPSPGSPGISAPRLRTSAPAFDTSIAPREAKAGPPPRQGDDLAL